MLGDLSSVKSYKGDFSDKMPEIYNKTLLDLSATQSSTFPRAMSRLISYRAGEGDNTLPFLPCTTSSNLSKESTFWSKRSTLKVKPNFSPLNSLSEEEKVSLKGLAAKRTEFVL